MEVESQFGPLVPGEAGQFFSIARNAGNPSVWKAGEGLHWPRPAGLVSIGIFCLRAVFGYREFWRWNLNLGHGLLEKQDHSFL